MKNRACIAALTLTLAVALGAPAVAADFEQAMSYYKSSKFLEAASEFQALVDENPDYADGYFMLAVCFMRTNKLGDAEKNLMLAVEKNPDKFEYHFNLANVYTKMKKWDKAIGTLNTAEGLAANDQYKQAIYKLRGMASYNSKDYEDAIIDLEKLQAPDDAALAAIGKAYFTLGDYDKASSSLQKAIEANPQNAELVSLQVETLLNRAAKSSSSGAKKSLYGQALAQAKSFKGLEGDTFDSQYLVGRSALGAQDYPLAATSFKAALAKNPKHCNAMINLGKSYMGAKDWAQATAALDDASKCDGNVSTVWENLGFALQKQEKLEDAIAKYDMALKLKPGSSFAQTNKDICLQNLEIKQHNAAMAAEQAKNEAEIAKAKEEFEAAKAKEEEWQKRQEEDD